MTSHIQLMVVAQRHPDILNISLGILSARASKKGASMAANGSSCL
jgi:hypothetical protein